MIKTYNCFSLKMAGYLMYRGFILFELKKDNKSNRNIFMFRNSEELKRAIDDYKNIK